MNLLLQSLRDEPLSFLPQKSLKALRHFLSGYRYRSMMEGRPYDLQVDLREFHRWLSKRFQVNGAAAIADIGIISLFYGDESEAFDAYFLLLEEFLSENHLPEPKIEGQWDRKDFVSTVKAIRDKPPLYLGHATFLGLSSYLMGDERAYQDLGLPSEEGRETFRDFQKWIETHKNPSTLSRPWFKVVEFWSGSIGIDCGHTSGGAYTLFFF